MEILIKNYCINSFDVNHHTTPFKKISLSGFRIISLSTFLGKK